jgi:hypothetical protein
MNVDLDPVVIVRCQARPAAARPGYREDMLCASMAATNVDYRGTKVPACRMHLATYARWASDAEANAELKWSWSSAAKEPIEL